VSPILHPELFSIELTSTALVIALVAAFAGYWLGRTKR